MVSLFFLKKKVCLFVYSFLAVLGLYCYAGFLYLQWVGTILQRKQWHPTPVLLPGNSHGQRSLVGCSPWGHWVGHDFTLVAVCGLLTVLASPVAEYRLQGAGWKVLHTGSVAPQRVRPGIKLVSPALAGGFLTTRPSGKPYCGLLTT